MSLKVEVKTSFFSASEKESFNRIITTAKGSRVVRPYFGSDLYLLIDRNIDEEWKMLFNKYLLECFFDENYVPWDKRLVPKSSKIISVDDSTVIAKLEFEDSSIEIQLGGF